MFQRILIANRGEIALRILRACREMGVEAVCVYSTADRDAPYLPLADKAVCIGPPLAAESYLNVVRIIAAAEVTGSEAIHPGYGFLAENADFVEKCRESEIEFIGPPHQAMRLLGDKAAARELAEKSGVPCVPGSDGAVADPATALKIARDIGYPVLVKAAAGGGGRGMRVARDDDSLRTGLAAASQEAKASFGDGTVYIEKLVENPRHVEVQLIADRHGHVVHLWERDCSTQRRYQKLIEESPAPRLPDDVRRSMCAAAVRLVRAADYDSAITVEFIVDAEDNYYFIEANTRIQVEHPVTELVTGIDLIKAMIRVAAGEELSFTQQDVVARGCAIECRINAEDPDRDFRPSPGRIGSMTVPGGFGVRFDSHATAGYMVPPTYDSMIGKLLVHQPTRAEAIACMRRALAELRIEGIRTTVPLHERILRDARFVEGRMDTKYLEREFMPAGR